MRNHPVQFAVLLGVVLLVACAPASPATVIEEIMSPSDSKPLVIAHRGARSLAPENTLAAARKAHEMLEGRQTTGKVLLTP